MTALLDVDQLRTFIAIAETGSFTRAADVVFKTQAQAKARGMAAISALRRVARRPAVIGDMRAPAAR